MEGKTCIRCGKHHTLDRFPTWKKSDGSLGIKNVCKDCHAASQRKYYKNNRESIRKKKNSYYKSEEGRKYKREYVRNYRKSEQVKLKDSARRKVNKAITSGKLLVPKLCEVCGLEKPLEAHHDDYAEPLSVSWLCKQCHTDHHNN